MAVTVLPPVSYETVVAHYEGSPRDLGRREYVEAKVKQSVSRLQARFGTRVAARLESGALPLDLYEATIADAVLRIVRNPEGYDAEEQGNYSYRVRAVVASGYLWFTSENMTDLLGESSSVIGTFTIGDHWRR